MARTKGALGKKTLERMGMAESLNPVTMKPRGNKPYTYRATSCGCEQTTLLLGAGMWCKHKNSMIRVID